MRKYLKIRSIWRVFCFKQIFNMKTSRFVVVFIIVFLSFFFIFSLIILSLTLFRKNETNLPTETSHFSKYLLQVYHPSSKDTTFGMVSMSKKLSDEDFLSYPSADGESYNVISKFVSDQYECTGSCFCSESRRSISSSLKLPLFLLISASSTAVAMKIAEKNFEDQCLSEISDKCSDEKIQSSTSSCSKTDPRMKEPEAMPVEEFYHYVCDGYCINNIHFTSPKAVEVQKEYFRTVGECAKLKKSAMVAADRIMRDERLFKHYRKEGDLHVHPDNRVYVKAVNNYWEESLEPFCREMSMRIVDEETGEKESMCIGSDDQVHFPDHRMMYRHENIDCYRLPRKYEETEETAGLGKPLTFGKW